MNTFTVVFFCVQACLVQNVFGQCTSRAAVVAEPLGSPLAYNGLAGLRGIAPAAAAIAPGVAAPYAGITGWGGAIAPAAVGPLRFPGALGWADEAIAPYGGVGEGNVAVAGELPVTGTTAIAGQVPIMGAVSFGGPVVAAGAVSIAAQNACDAPVQYIMY